MFLYDKSYLLVTVKFVAYNVVRKCDFLSILLFIIELVKTIRNIDIEPCHSISNHSGLLLGFSGDIVLLVRSATYLEEAFQNAG